MLSNRLALAADLYEPCALGADIGTDHALLPCHLLEKGICGRMILSDISPKALQHARAQVTARGLTDRVTLLCAPGLEALRGTPCGCVSVMGMGGETIAEILRGSSGELRGAVLILSPQTELPLVRGAALALGYRPEAERLCMDGGRYYQVWRFVPGEWKPDAEELRYGRLLYETASPMLGGFLAHRVRVTESRLRGLERGGETSGAAWREAQEDLAFYRGKQRGAE